MINKTKVINGAIGNMGEQALMGEQTLMDSNSEVIILIHLDDKKMMIYKNNWLIEIIYEMILKLIRMRKSFQMIYQV